MRNLKRALSLALASVMLVGMMVVGASAASFPDVDASDNTEAIAVLKAVEVMIGDADTGNFRPNDNVSRNEMAVIMAKLLLGKDADSYVGSHPFTDVPEWAGKYVAACYNEGIVAGMTETTYDGASTVTAEQAAAMMLRALGYEKLEGTGANWAQPVVAKANQISLFAGVGSNPKAPMTRNQVAQLSLNTLEATTVTTVYNSQDIQIGDVTIPGNVTYEKNTDTKAYAKAIDEDQDSNNNYYVELGEKLYNGDLKKDASTGADDFGRPDDYKWTMKGVSSDDLPAVAKEAVAVFTGETSADDVASALSGYYVTYDVSTPSNNVPINNKTTLTTGTIGATNDGCIKIDIAAAGETAAKAIANKTANGKVLEFFADTNNQITHVVQIEYKVSTVTSVRETSKGTTYAVSPGGSGVVYNADQDEDDTAVVMGTVAEDDIVTVARSTDGKVLYIYPTSNFTGVQTSRNVDKETITVDGTTYDVGMGVNGVDMDDFANSKDDTTFYVDQFGYVVKSEAVADNSEYAAVDEIRYVSDGGIGSSKSVEARLVFTDGTSEIVKVTEINGLKVSDSAFHKKDDSTYTTVGITNSGTDDATQIVLSTDIDDNTALCGKVVKFSKSGSNYTLEYNVTSGTVTHSGAAATNAKVTEEGRPSFVYNGTTTASGNKDTVYIIKTDEGEYSVYTGYQNVADVTAGSTNTVPVSYYQKDDGKVNVVFIDASASDASVGGTTVEIVYILDFKAYNEFRNDDDEKRYEYTNAALNGDDSEPVISQVKFGENGLYEVNLTDDGEVKSIKSTGSATDYYKLAVTKDSDDADTLYANGKGYSCISGDIYVVDDKNFYEGDGTDAEAGDVVYIKSKDNAGRGTSKDDITVEVAYIVKGEAGASVLDEDATATEIKEALTTGGSADLVLTETGSKLAGDPVIVAAGKNVTAMGDISGNTTIKTTNSTNSVTIDTATVNGTLDLTDAVNVTVKDTEVVNELKVDEAKVEGTLTMPAGAKLTVNKDVDLSDGSIDATENAEITFGGEAVPTKLLASENFYATDGSPITDPSALAGKTFKWNETGFVGRSARAAGAPGWYEQGDGTVTPPTDPTEITEVTVSPTSVTLTVGESFPTVIMKNAGIADTTGKWTKDGAEVTTVEDNSTYVLTFELEPLTNYTLPATTLTATGIEYNETTVSGVYTKPNVKYTFTVGTSVTPSVSDISGLSVTPDNVTLTVDSKFPEVTMKGTGIADAGITGVWSEDGSDVAADATVTAGSTYKLTFTLEAKDSNFSIPASLTADAIPSIGDVTGTYSKPTVTYTFAVPADEGGGDTEPTATIDASKLPETIYVNDSLTGKELSVTVENGTATAWQWKKSADQSTWTEIESATTASYAPSTEEAGEIYYVCEVTLDGGSKVTATAVKVTVVAKEPVAEPTTAQVGKTGALVDLSKSGASEITALKGIANTNEVNLKLVVGEGVEIKSVAVAKDSSTVGTVEATPTVTSDTEVKVFTAGENESGGKITITVVLSQEGKADTTVVYEFTVTAEAAQ